MNSSKSTSIMIGQRSRDDGDNEPTGFACEDPMLLPHLHRPWLRAWVGQQLGVSLKSSSSSEADTLSIDKEALARHTLLVGSTGAGKSRLQIHLLREQWRQGCSLVLFDPKEDTIKETLAALAKDGVTAGQITVLNPRHSSGVPGWNPFLIGIPLAQAVSDFVVVLKQSYSSWGPRLEDLLVNALLIISSHKLSLFELARFLMNENYRENLLALPIQSQDPLAYAEARAYFQSEFGSWSRSGRAEAISPVLNKLRELLRSSFLHPFLCARQNTLNLGLLWQKQHVVLVHLDKAGLGDEGAKLLTGLLVHSLFRTAMRTSGKVPVVLAIDELATVAQMVGTPLTEIVTVARSKGLRLQVAFQHLEQLPSELRTALLANAATQVFFRLGYADARLAAASLAAGQEAHLKRVTLTAENADRKSGQVARTQWRHEIQDAWGNPLRLRSDLWEKLQWEMLLGQNGVQLLKEMVGTSGAMRLYVKAPDTGQPIEIAQYVRGLAPTDFSITGPAPLELVVSFPRPKLTGVERGTESDQVQGWIRTLQELPIQHAVVRCMGLSPCVTRIVDVTLPPLQGHSALLADALRRNGQSVEEIIATREWREAQVERIASGRGTPPSPPRDKEEDDVCL